MGNTLKMDKQELIKRLFGLGWSDRKINRSTGINRRTLSRYRKLTLTNERVHNLMMTVILTVNSVL